MAGDLGGAAQKCRAPLRPADSAGLSVMLTINTDKILKSVSYKQGGDGKVSRCRPPAFGSAKALDIAIESRPEPKAHFCTPHSARWLMGWGSEENLTGNELAPMLYVATACRRVP